MSGFTLPLSKVIQELSLTTFYTPCDPEEVLISSRDVNRPGLELHGFFDYYDTTRILIIGNAENAYLTSCSDEKKAQALDAVLERNRRLLFLPVKLNHVRFFGKRLKNMKSPCWEQMILPLA